MDKDKSNTNSWKSDGRGARGNVTQSRENVTTVSQHVLDHSNRGEFNTQNRHKSGGHGQQNIDYMDKNGIEYEINMEYNNGVRVGNILNSKQKFSRQGNNHTWFPKEWTEADIISAGEYVSNAFTGTKANKVTHSEIVNGVKVTVMFNSKGEIVSIYPYKNQPGGKK